MAQRGGYRQRQAKIALSQLEGKARSSATDPVAQSARKLLQGKGWTEADLARVVEFNGGGKGRSTATAVQRAQRAFSSRVQTTQNYITSISQLATAGTSAAGRANITLQITKDIEQALKTKLVKTLALSVSKYLGENPAASKLFLRSLGAGLRIGGAVATVALLGIEAADSYFETRRRAAKADIASLNLKRALQIDGRQTKTTEAAIDFATKGSASVVDQLGDDFGVSANVKEEAEQTKQNYYKNLTKARGRLGELGINENRVLADGAHRLGKTVGQLSDEERQSILDEAVNLAYQGGVVQSIKTITIKNSDTASVGRTAQATLVIGNAKYLNDPRVLSRLAKEGYGPGNTALLVKYALEQAASDLSRDLSKVGELAEVAATIRSRRSGAEQWKAQEELKKGAAEFSSYRLRQRPYITN